MFPHTTKSFTRTVIPAEAGIQLRFTHLGPDLRRGDVVGQGDEGYLQGDELENVTP